MVVPSEVEELVASLLRRIERLEAENAELRRRLDLDSTNSSKPPSSDGLKKKPRILRSLRTRTGKRSGGQRGHRGDTLRQVAEPDAIVEHAAEVCEHCQARLLADSKVGEEKRQVFDLPEKPLIVTEHRAAIHDCRACGRRTRADFPEGVVSPAQYGERVKAAGVYLNAQQLVPEERTAQILQDLFGAAAACGASVAAWVRRKAEALAPVYRGIGVCVAATPVRCLDETGFRIAGTTRWLHTASTLTHTFYRADEPRSAVPEFEGGVVVHDHWRAYYGLQNVDHAFCNAHLLRELQAVREFDQEPWEANDSGYYGATLAAIAVGTAPRNYASTPDIQDNVTRLREYLNREEAAQSTINRVFLLWASTRLPRLLSPEQQKAIVQEILSKQQSDGGWRLASIAWKWRGWSLKSFTNMWLREDGTPMEGKSDGVATSLTILALEESGVPRDNAQLKRGLSWLMSNQNATDGSWPASSVNKRRHKSSETGLFMSDAATAFAVIALTDNQQTASRVASAFRH